MRFKNPALIQIIAGFIFLFSCTATKPIPNMENKPVVPKTASPSDSMAGDHFLEDLMKQYPAYFSEILKNRKAWNVQVIYTQVNRGPNGEPVLEQHDFNTDASRYFYPASTVKLPIVLLALQRLNELKSKGIDKYTTMITEKGADWQTPVYNDPTTPDGRPSIAHYIKKILMVSDNDAFNRLYEFLGQGYINDQLHKKGYPSAQILHHLNIFLTEEQNSETNPVRFLDNNNNPIYDQLAQTNTARYKDRNDSIGNAYYKAGKLINEPMNFSKKNRITLQDLTNILISLVFPGKVKPSQRFNLSDEDKQFVLKYMSQLPTESIYPAYGDDTANYWPAYGKQLLFGTAKGKWPDHIRIFNKEGDAYGHMLDIAYVVDFENKVEFFLSALIYCNSDGILNDDKYDYNTIGLPFMKNLGQVIYSYELKRQRKNKPDLSPFIFKYDK